MPVSNYELTRERMQAEFLKYDQALMVKKFSLKEDAERIYIRFAGRGYGVMRSNGLVERNDDGTTAGFNESMTIYDILCYSKENCRLSGKFSSVNNIRGTVYGSGMRVGESLGNSDADFFDRKADLLRRACELLGGTPEKVGDVSYRLPLFDFLPVILQFWESDDEFPANLKLMWDENIFDYMHYETTYYASACLIKRLKELVNELGGAETGKTL